MDDAIAKPCDGHEHVVGKFPLIVGIPLLGVRSVTVLFAERFDLRTRAHSSVEWGRRRIRDLIRIPASEGGNRRSGGVTRVGTNEQVAIVDRDLVRPVFVRAAVQEGNCRAALNNTLVVDFVSETKTGSQM